MSAQQPRVMGHRRLPFLQRVLIHGAVACVLAAAGYNFIVRPERSRLSSALASLTSQEHDLQETQDLPHVVDDIPAAIIQMSQRRDQLLARLKDSGDASTLYAKIGKIAQRCGVRTDRIDPIRADNRTVASASLLDASNGIVLETYGYQIEVIGSYENIAKFTDAINKIVKSCTECHPKYREQ